MSEAQPEEQKIQQEVDKIIRSITNCVERGEGKGKCHVFLGSDICQCGDIDLTKERMR